MSKYEKLDAAILAAIGHERIRFAYIECDKAVAEEARSISDVQNEGMPQRLRIHWSRVIDRRLQALRRAGKIKASPKGWTRTDVKREVA